MVLLYNLWAKCPSVAYLEGRLKSNSQFYNIIHAVARRYFPLTCLVQDNFVWLATK